MHLLFSPVLANLIWVGGGSVGVLLLIVVVVLLVRRSLQRRRSVLRSGFDSITDGRE